MALKVSSNAAPFFRLVGLVFALIGTASLVWTCYLYLRYGGDLQKSSAGLITLVVFIMVGLGLFLLLPDSNGRRESLRVRVRKTFGYADKLLFYGCIPLVVILLTVLTSQIQSRARQVLLNTEILPVVVQLKSKELRYIPKEFIATDPIWEKLQYLQSVNYEEVWAAWGEVLVQEVDGGPIAPRLAAARLTSLWSQYRRAGRLHYVTHSKIDAMIDLEQLSVGESYKGWVFREHPNDVFFTRPSDHSLQAIWRLLAIIAVLLAYMPLRIVIGIKRRARNTQAAPGTTTKRSAKR